MNAEKMVKGARIEGLVQQMNALAEVRDCEDRHWQADALLCAILRSLGYGPVVDEYDKLDKHWA